MGGRRSDGDRGLTGRRPHGAVSTGARFIWEPPSIRGPPFNLRLAFDRAMRSG
jgi:hypothetical protein